MTPQEKLIAVGNALGVTSLKYMQGSTGTLYHGQNIATGPGAQQPNFTFFGNALQGATWIYDTNVNEGAKLEVNEAFLIEKIQFNRISYSTNAQQGIGAQNSTESQNGAIVDVVIGNKRVLKQVRTQPVNPYISGTAQQYYETAEIFLEGAGIVIPPQVEFSVNAFFFYNDSLTPISGQANYGVQCILYGTRVLLNLNTSL